MKRAVSMLPCGSSLRHSAAMDAEPIYKICTAREWADAVRLGHYAGSAVDAKDGFIHFSTARQVAETARRHFTGQSGLVLVTVDAALLQADLKWEASRGGDLFPHLYAPLPTDAATDVRPLPLGDDGTPVLPEFQSGD
jgi:uncharacterized protein (DUF952 family)